jgi:hypothetical protein
MKGLLMIFFFSVSMAVVKAQDSTILRLLFSPRTARAVFKSDSVALHSDKDLDHFLIRQKIKNACKVVIDATPDTKISSFMPYYKLLKKKGYKITLLVPKRSDNSGIRQI